MKTFIAEVAEELLQNHKDELDRVRVIFPNRRAGIFLRRELGKLISSPTWLPEISSLEDFIVKEQPYDKIDTLEAVFLLHEVYKKHQPNEEDLEKFYFWGEMILRDFDEIDQYLVEPANLFRSIKTQKELDEEFFFLDDEEKKILESFWSTFLPEASKSQQAFLETWKLLHPIYEDFRKTLSEKGKGYTGLIYREYLDQLRTGRKPACGIIYFAGFNALTYSEEGIIKHYVQECNAKIFWDADPYYMVDARQEAGTFLRQYSRDKWLGKDFDREQKSSFNAKKDITVTGVSLEMGQAKAMSEDLARVLQEQDYSPQDTVIVLPHEYMLFPVLESLPEGVNQINITMGYPLKDTPVYSLLDSMLHLQETRRINEINGVAFYHRPLLDIIEHPLLNRFASEKSAKLTADIRSGNRIYIYLKDFPELGVPFDTVFVKAEQPLEYMQGFLEKLHDLWREEEYEIENEFIGRFYDHLAKLTELMGSKSADLTYEFVRKLFRRIAQSLKVPFTGEPLNGLQIMGILETRNLDFANVMVLNMNEDAWPAPAKKGSFIPYNIRRAFQLPTHEHQDSIYSYLFYRLLQRAERVKFYHNTVSEFNVNGEISRLIRQLEFESPHQLHRRVLSNPVNVIAPQAIVIPKSSTIMRKLSRYTWEGKAEQSRLTPSALDTYLYCRLRFYFRYVEQIYEADELKDEMDAAIFGNILHDAMEILYDQFIQRQKRNIIEPFDFFGLEAGIEGALNLAFKKHFKTGLGSKDKFEYEGRNIVAREIILKMIRQILKIDQRYAPFKIVGLEAGTREGYSVDYPIKSEGRTIKIRLKGKIDRLDIKQGVVRVVDYKTGKDEKNFESVESLIDRDNKNRNKAAFQILFYSFLVEQGYTGEYDRIEPGLFNSRELFSQDFDWRINHKTDGRVTNFIQYSDQFEEVLRSLLTEIWDTAVPFDQVEDSRKCQYCPYNTICNR